MWGIWGGVGWGRTKAKEQKMMISGVLWLLQASVSPATSPPLGLAVSITARWADPGADDSGRALAAVLTNWTRRRAREGRGSPRNPVTRQGPRGNAPLPGLSSVIYLEPGIGCKFFLAVFLAVSCSFACAVQTRRGTRMFHPGASHLAGGCYRIPLPPATASPRGAGPLPGDRTLLSAGDLGSGWRQRARH